MVNTIKFFKKNSPNGKVTVYLSSRDFVDHISHTSPVDGVVVVDNDYLRGRKVFARVVVTFRYGREEDEVMGLSFSKDLELLNTEVVAEASGQDTMVDMECLVQKLGPEARPFSLMLPDAAPPSVTLDPGKEGTAKTLGVTYELIVYMGEGPSQQPPRHSSVVFPVRRVQHAPDRSTRCPCLLIIRSFTFFPGKVSLEVHLDRDLYFHGQPVDAQIMINNASKKTVKYVVMQVLQHVEVTVTHNHFSRVVASIESHEGCPIIPSSRYFHSISLTPLPFNTFGVALEGHAQDQDVCLASSTVMAACGSAKDDLGIIVSYSLTVKLNCGAISGEVTADLPFKLMHPSPAVQRRTTLQRTKSVDDDILIEEFMALRRGRSLTDSFDD